MLSHARHVALAGMTAVLPFLLSVIPVQATESPSTTSSDAGAPLPGVTTESSRPVELILSSSSPRQGDTIKVSVRGDMTAGGGGEDRTVSFNGESFKLFEDGPGLSCLLGISPEIEPGKYPVTFGGISKQVTVIDGKFPTQHLRLPKKKDNFIASPGEKETIKKAKQIVSAERYWKGKFEKPVKVGRISSVFGIRRIVNGKLLKDYYHSGTDFAAGRGTPIHACAAGKVVVARTGWRLHGNTVCIDHGQGVISIYIHMNSVSVKEGDLVKSGQMIGAVGSTGRASGPHLHFGVYVNNACVNPASWFVKTY